MTSDGEPNIYNKIINNPQNLFSLMLKIFRDYSLLKSKKVVIIIYPLFGLSLRQDYDLNSGLNSFATVLKIILLKF